MRNYLTGKERLLVALLAFILPFSFAKAEVREDGKTGQQAPKDNVQMPDKILNVNIIPSKEDVKKSYLFITSRDRLGEFVSFQNGVLTFKYNSQEYKYNLEKMKEPLLVIDGRLADRFDIDPSEILQIRPISPIEKEVGYYPNAEVIINTK